MYRNKTMIQLFNAKSEFSILLTNNIEPLFKNNAFKKEKTNCWTQINEEVIIRISLVKSIKNTSNYIQFYFKISICSIDDFCINSDFDNANKSFICTQNQFLTEKAIMNKQKTNPIQNEWYTLFRENNLLANEITNDFENYVFPILKQIKSKDQVIKLQLFENNNYGKIWYIDEEYKSIDKWVYDNRNYKNGNLQEE